MRPLFALTLILLELLMSGVPEVALAQARDVVQGARAQAAEAGADLTAFPPSRALPIVVRAAVYFVDIAAIKESDGTFTATIDLRLRWSDSRLRFEAVRSAGAYRELRGAAADAKLAQIWSPEVRLANMIGEPAHQTRGLRLYSDGRVELLQRTTAQFSVSFYVECFPFDQQKLGVALATEHEPSDRVTLEFHQDELDFSRASSEIAITGWTPGLVSIRRAPLSGWNGESHARLWFELAVARQPLKTVPPIFIPLFASLLIPLIAIWLNRFENGSFRIEAIELANIVVGGLFAVIALNFTVMGEYKTLASGDNMVMRLFALNYTALGLSLIINLALFRYNLVERLFGKYVQEQVYYFLAWAFPLLAVTAAVTIVLLAVV